MNRPWSFLAGVLGTILFSLCGLVLIPDWQFQDQKPVLDEYGNLIRPNRQGPSIWAGKFTYPKAAFIATASRFAAAPSALTSHAIGANVALSQETTCSTGLT